MGIEQKTIFQNDNRICQNRQMNQFILSTIVPSMRMILTYFIIFLEIILKTRSSFITLCSLHQAHHCLITIGLFSVQNYQVIGLLLFFSDLFSELYRFYCVFKKSVRKSWRAYKRMKSIFKGNRQFFLLLLLFTLAEPLDRNNISQQRHLTRTTAQNYKNSLIQSE